MNEPLIPPILDAVERVLPGLVEAARSQLLSEVLKSGSVIDTLRNTFTDERISQLDHIPALTKQRTMMMRIYIESGEWHCPGPNTPVFVLAIGGGSGGVTTHNASQAGGASSFGQLITAAGGAAVPGFSTSGNATSYPCSIDAGPFGFGNGGYGMHQGVRGSGKKGQTVTFFGMVSADQPVTIGQGGQNYNNNEGNRGGNGAVLIFWWEAL